MTDSSAVQDHWAGEWVNLVQDHIAYSPLLQTEGTLEQDLRLLAPFDHFHAGGLKTTERLLDLMGLRPGYKLRGVDIGSGLGGPARWFANKLQCKVAGFDLTPQLVGGSNEISRYLEMDARCPFFVADACRLPSETGSFDFAIMMALTCNISDRQTLYESVHRVLKPGGILGVLDIITAEEGGKLITPVPWSVDGKEDTSLLLTRQHTIIASAAAGLEHFGWLDVSDIALSWFEKEERRLESTQLFGWENVLPRWPEMVNAQIENLLQRNIRFNCMAFRAA